VHGNLFSFKNSFPTLPTAYQTEIDSLTRRCKNSENAFLSVYKALAEAPDPYPLLDLAVDQTVKISQVASLESEITRLRQENSTLLSKVEGQGSNDRERRKAEKKAEILEERMEDLVKERVSAKENELKAIYEERLLNYEER
jgi:homeobox protein cut-like